MIHAENVEIETEVEAKLLRAVARNAASARTLSVVELDSGVGRSILGDTPTRDARTLAYFSYPAGAVLPAFMRSDGTAFYVCGHAAPELAGKLVRRG